MDDWRQERGRVGFVTAGFSELAYGLDRAEAFYEEGAPEGPELVARYRDALDEYTAAYGAALLR